jgi:hypothetical protein
MTPPVAATRELDLIWERLEKVESELVRLSSALTKCFWASIVATAAIGGPPIIEQIFKAMGS